MNLIMFRMLLKQTEEWPFCMDLWRGAFIHGNKCLLAKGAYFSLLFILFFADDGGRSEALGLEPTHGSPQRGTMS